MAIGSFVDPFGLWGRASRLGARAGAGAVDRALASPLAEHAVRTALEGPLVDVAVRALVRGRVLDRLVARMLEDPATERLLQEALDAPGMERLVVRVLDSRLVDAGVQHLLAGDELWLIVDEVARSPAVTDAITHQGASFADEVAGEVGQRSRRVDAWLERGARRVLHRPPPSRDAPAAGPGGEAP